MQVACIGSQSACTTLSAGIARLHLILCRSRPRYLFMAEFLGILASFPGPKLQLSVKPASERANKPESCTDCFETSAPIWCALPTPCRPRGGLADKDAHTGKRLYWTWKARLAPGYNASQSLDAQREMDELTSAPCHCSSPTSPAVVKHEVRRDDRMRTDTSARDAVRSYWRDFPPQALGPASAA